MHAEYSDLSKLLQMNLSLGSQNAVEGQNLLKKTLYASPQFRASYTQVYRIYAADIRALNNNQAEDAIIPANLYVLVLLLQYSCRSFPFALIMSLIITKHRPTDWYYSSSDSTRNQFRKVREIALLTMDSHVVDVGNN